MQATGVARTVGTTGRLRNLQRPSWSVADDGRIKITKEEGVFKRKDAQENPKKQDAQEDVKKEGRTRERTGGKLTEAAPPWDCQKVGAVGCN